MTPPPPARPAFCVHGHFYQPDRRNPWTGRIDDEPSAAPWPNWNRRILDECYRPNAAARILGSEAAVTAIVSNYESISWNAGPSLMSWLESADPWTYEALLDADGRGARAHGGHGPAMAQTWVHSILPLAHPDDRRTLVRWGRADFEHRFRRPPEGMWLPEAAVDTASLEALAAEGIAFTVLAPWQASEVRTPGGMWKSATDALDTSHAYRVDLPNGRSIAVYFYDGELSSGVAFGGLLHDGARFADAIADAAATLTERPGSGDTPPATPMVHLATDGESYGHHHRFGEMALAFAIERLRSVHGLDQTTYGAHLVSNPPTHEARITDPSAWSCAHGVERWRSDCGDRIGTEEGWTQAWRTPLRDAIDWLRDTLATEFEGLGRGLFDDPWVARDGYIDVLLGRVPTVAFLPDNGVPEGDGVAALSLLESQRHFLQATESSAWFYDDAAGLEVTMALRHAKRALELVQRVGGRDLERDLVAHLAPMRSNQPDRADGSTIWSRQVVPAAVTPVQVAGRVLASMVAGGPGEPAMSIPDLPGGRIISTRNPVRTDRQDGATVTAAIVVVEDVTGYTHEVGGRAERRGAEISVQLDGGPPMALAELGPAVERRVLLRLLRTTCVELNEWLGSDLVGLVADVAGQVGVGGATLGELMDAAFPPAIEHKGSHLDGLPPATILRLGELIDRLGLPAPLTRWWTDTLTVELDIDPVGPDAAREA